MSRVEAFDHAQQPAPALSSQSACKNNFGEHIVEGRKEGKNGGSGKKVILSLFYEGGRIQF